MVKIDKELLKKRAEHNDGELSTLREITLHQFDIEKIENLDIYCKQLEILLLQNNQISKIENLQKLKSLRYLNLALNNIKVIENLERCESLEKLDLTVNFVDDLLCIESLKNNEFLQELFVWSNCRYLVGNPCCQVDGYREFVITVLPQLKSLDGREITRSERIAAAQKYQQVRERIQSSHKPKVDESLKNSELVEAVNSATDEQEKKKLIEEKRSKFKEELSGHTPEERLQVAKELDLLRNGVKQEKKTKTTEEIKRPILNSEGKLLQRNEGKWEFRFEYVSKDTITLVVQVSKYLDTSFIDVDVHSEYLTLLIKGKVLQLNLEEPVQTDNCVCERSRMTGDLVITMLKQKSKENSKIEEIHSSTKRQNGENQRSKFEAILKNQNEANFKPRNRRYDRLFEPIEAVDIHNIVKNEKPLAESKIRDAKFVKTDIKPTVYPDFVDDPSVPPLC